MFLGCSAFNQPIGEWDVTRCSTFALFLFSNKQLLGMPPRVRTLRVCSIVRTYILLVCTRQTIQCYNWMTSLLVENKQTTLTACLWYLSPVEPGQCEGSDPVCRMIAYGNLASSVYEAAAYELFLRFASCLCRSSSRVVERAGPAPFLHMHCIIIHTHGLFLIQPSTLHDN